MKNSSLGFSALFIAFLPRPAWCSPLRLVGRDAMPATTSGRFDHLGVDGNRRFLAAESEHRVLIFDLRSGKYLGDIPGIQIPHAIFVRPDVNRIYITDGGAGG